MTAMEVEKPTVVEAAKAAPIAAPSQKLWMPSPKITIKARDVKLGEGRERVDVGMLLLLLLLLLLFLLSGRRQSLEGGF